jgi:hypothetical protein
MTLCEPDVDRDQESRNQGSCAAVNVVRHRQVFGVFSVLCAGDLHLKAMRTGKGARNPISFEQMAARMSDRHFKRVFRLPRAVFFGLCSLLNEYYCRSVRVRRETGLSVPVSLSMTLRWLAGGSYLDIALWNHVSVSTFYFIVDNIIADFVESGCVTLLSLLLSIRVM